MRLWVLGLSALMATGAQAEGFGVRDLSEVASPVSAALGAGFSQRLEPRRLTLTCPTCKGSPMIDLLLGRQTDGTEQRVRSGETSIARLETLCQEKSPSCRVAGLSVAPAVGWITTYPMGTMTGSTAVLLRDGDLLTIRALASDAGTARSYTEKVLGALKPKVTGN